MKNTLIAIGYAFCWGIGLTLAKLALAEIGATTLLIIQLLSSVLFLFALCAIKQRSLPISVKHLKQGKAGIFEPALAYMVGTLGLSLTTATNASLIGSTEVVLTILFAAVFLNEKLTLTKLGLAILSFSGVLLLIEADQGAGTQSLVGDLLVLLGTVFAVAYVLISKTTVATINPLELTASQQFVGLLVTVLCLGSLSVFNSNYEVSVVGISLPFWLLAVTSGILQYGLAFFLYLTALQTIPVSQAAFYIALIPVFGVGSAILLLGERTSLVQWIGAACVLLSSYWANRLKASEFDGATGDRS